MHYDIDTHLNKLSDLTDQYRRSLDVAISLESIAESYDFESFEASDFKMLGHLVQTTLMSNGLTLDALSMEVDAVTPASDAATGVATKTDNIKAGLKKAAETIMEQAKNIGKTINEYLKRLEQVLLNSTTALKNSVSVIENKLNNQDVGTGKIKGNFSIFDKQKPQLTLALVSTSASVLSKSIKPLFDDYVKKAKGDATQSDIKLSLKDHTGAEYKYDGTTKFFKPETKFTATEMTSLTKSDIIATCKAVTDLIAALDDISKQSKQMASVNYDSLIASTSSGDAKVKASVKEVMSISSFQRNVVGGYVKYAIKVAQASLDACNKSIVKKGDTTNV